MVAPRECAKGGQVDLIIDLLYPVHRKTLH